MANCCFGWPMYADPGVSFSPVLSGGSWQAALPLANLQDRRLAKIARSTDATSASTTFDCDLGTARGVGVLSILVPNLTKSAVPTIQWKGSTVSNFASTVYDSGAVQAWPSALTAENSDGLNVWLTTIPPAIETARYWRVAIVDTANVNGYLNVARLVIAGKYSPTANFSLGSKTSLETETIRTVTDGGAALYYRKPIRRGHTISLGNIQESEAIPNPWQLTRLLGTSGQLFFVYDQSDVYMYERAFLSVLRTLGPLTNPDYRYTQAFDIVEEL